MSFIFLLILSLIFLDPISSLPELWNQCIDIITPFLSSDVLSWPGITLVFNGIIEPLKVVGFALSVCLWLYGMLKVEASLVELKRPEAVFKHMLRLIIMIWAVQYAPEIVKGIWNIGLALVTTVSPPAVVDDGTVGSIVFGALGGTSTLGHLSPTILDGVAVTEGVDLSLPVVIETGAAPAGAAGELGKLLIVQLLSFICNLGAKIVILLCAYQIFSNIITRFFKMTLLYVISPIAASAAASEDTQRISIQFVKNVIAVSSEMALITILLRIFPYVATVVLKNDEIGIVAGVHSLIETFLSGILNTFADYTVNGGVVPFGDYLTAHLTGTLLFVLLLFTLKSSIRGLGSIIDSLFGLHGV